MAAKKFSISVPKEVMKQVDLAAKKKGVTRSRFVTMLLQEAARARTEAELRRKIATFFADPEVAKEDAEMASAFAAGGNPSGTRW